VAILARGAEPVETRRGLPGDPGDTHSRYIEAAIGGFAFGRDAGLRIDHLLLSPSFFWSAYATAHLLASSSRSLSS
jgi:exonuclease III